MHHRELAGHPARAQVMRALAKNREPGYHFCGNFIELIRAESEGFCLQLGPHAHCLDPDGQVNPGIMCILADLALAGTVREFSAGLVRLATVSLNLQFTGAPWRGPLAAHAEFQGRLEQAAMPQGLTRVSILNGAQQVGFGNGAFMILPMPPGFAQPAIPWHIQQRDFPALAEQDLTEEEGWILRHMEESILCGASSGAGFLNHFFGFLPQAVPGGAVCAMRNGPHIANRVRHVQGGIQLGLAASTAAAALPPDWALAGLTACFLRPGEGEQIEAEAHIVHQGRNTATVRTRLMGGGRHLLEVLTTHAARSAA